MRDFKTSIFRALALLFLLAAGVLFCIALVETVFVTTEQAVQGYWIMLVGWMGFMIFQFAWFANPLALLALLLIRKRPWWALATSVLSLLCLSQAFLFSEIPTDTSGQSIAVVSRGIGFYCWVASIACVFYGTIMMLIYRAFKRDAMLVSSSVSETVVATPVAPPKTKPVVAKNKKKSTKNKTATPLAPPPEEVLNPNKVPVFHKNALSIPDGPISTPSNP
ncbi:hypothetical protein [Leucothrix mucor]|uniref:hypothetical protein n=1 Tax=Leucothrix mucor TaxID=45248 RepID=UPI0003B64428|nr:hypothetical protein [Leucothrix mucor]